MKGNNFIHPELKACVVAECLQEGYFGPGYLSQEYAEIILAKYPSISPRMLSRLSHDFFYPPNTSQTTSTRVKKAAKKKKHNNNKRGRPLKISKYLRDVVDNVGQEYADNYKICSAAEMWRRLNLLQIGSVSYDTVRRYMKEHLQQEKHQVRFFLVDGGHPRYDEIMQSFYNKKTGRRNNNQIYHYATEPIIHSKSRPIIMLWTNVHCPNHFLPPEYELQDEFKMHNKYGGSDTFRLVPVSMPVNTTESEWRRVMEEGVVYNMNPETRTPRTIDEDNERSRERNYLVRDKLLRKVDTNI